MKTSTKALIGAAALLAAFLIGFIPQYQKADGLRSEVRAAQDEANSLRSNAGISELRDLISLTFLETSAKNYGIARQYATRFFARAGEVAAGSSDEALKKLLGELCGERDRITAGLAEGQGAVQADIESLVRRLYAATTK